MKKLLCIISGLVILISVARAQPWMENLILKSGKKNLTLTDYQNAFNDYWDKY